MPCRNQLLLTLAAPWALERGIDTLILGIIASNHLHGDGSAEFVNAMNALFNVQGIAITVEAPAVGLSKAELLRRSGVPLEIVAMGHSCQTGEYACGYCRACNAHRAVVEELGWPSF
jgi:7-cyano-7-deazaguanine synthase